MTSSTLATLPLLTLSLLSFGLGLTGCIVFVDDVVGDETATEEEADDGSTSDDSESGSDDGSSSSTGDTEVGEDTTSSTEETETSTDTSTEETGTEETGTEETGTEETGTEETGTGETGTDPVCEPMDAEGVGPCDAFFGYAWTGEFCEGISGCECEGSDCADLYQELEPCEDDHALCELGDPCAPEDAQGEGFCDLFLGWAWDGDTCVPLSGCECVGSDCADLPLELEECEAAHDECGGEPPPSECGELGFRECAADPSCAPLNGSPLVDLPPMCLAPSVFVECGPGDLLCGDALTWACAPGEGALPVLFNSTCVPAGWGFCEPPPVAIDDCN